MTNLTYARAREYVHNTRQLVEKYDAGELEVYDRETGELLHFTYNMLFNAVSKVLACMSVCVCVSVYVCMYVCV